MATRVALNDADPGQQYAVIKDQSELNAGDRRAIRGASPVTLGTDGKTLVYPGDYDDLMKNALLARIVIEWNLTHPLPKGDASVFDLLTIDQIDRLYEAVDGHVKFLNGGVPDPNKRDSDPTDA